MAEKLKPEDNKDHNKPVDKTTFNQFVIDIEDLKSKASKNSGDMSAKLKLAEDVGIHKAAFKSVIALHQMSENARSDFLSAFDIYRDYLGLDDYDQGDMFDNDNDNTGTDEAA